MNLISLKFASVIAALLFSGAASAQYVWRDAKGGKQFSDQPPPASIPRRDILKEPSSEPRADTESAPAATTATAPLSTAERNADFRQRRMEQADKDKKAADEKAVAADKTANCARARAYQRSLEEGMRIASTDKNGERYTLNDNQRDVEIRNTRKVVNDCR
ncbi:DUF4124 domain-containing protein [Actimicrobium sp. CCC2.4]|uniref:DUF4124 domain-containing protein n=1 Tax=Actimicrobium sp. CCC2.4 TaxID=3048606 RepID=UPI002AC8FE20|nr:DUF4124 domain-containing protein [Actimicrobium sp. CCC2.4]MEB0134547.1 DUF4124 domain-containing protein [Actimicrobium sp. CCC2.4]WPX33990.1 DUF4124 domain-containing protein [Actimicrobium sp. CCC2.4]